MENVVLKFKKLDKRAVIPQFMTDGAACFDFVATDIEQIGKHECIIRLGLAVEFPKGYVLTMQPRSSFSLKGWVMANSPGQVDSDFRGELQIRLQAIPIEVEVRDLLYINSEEHYLEYPLLPYQVGDRVAQGRLEKLVPTLIEEAEELSTTERGEGGWGSTGVK